MPQLTKQALSQYIRSGCLRQLALNLYPDNETYRADRAALGMPYPQSPRPGLRQVQAAGDEWAEEKLHDLSQTFGAAALVGDPRLTPSNQTRFQPYPLEQALPQATPIRFLVECDFPVGPAFQTAMGIARYANQYRLDYTRLRPDLIVVLPPSSFADHIAPDGTVLPLPPGDLRRQLRVIDIKLTAQASPGYFAEVALYSMVLAGWLVDRHLDSDFVVVPEGAVWPGSHEASTLLRFSNQSRQQGLTPSVGELWQAMQDDLEPVPFEVFALRIRRFLTVDLERALSQHWQALEWHVDNRCSFCEYLGENRGANAVPPQAPHPDHCLPTAESLDHLSQVAFMSQGARLSLANHPTHPTATVADLAQRLPADPIFDDHQSLRATRTVVPERAAVLRGGQAHLAPQSGTSASMPRFANLHIYLSVDFDIGSAITVAFGMKGSWLEPRPRNANLATARQNRRWPTVARVIDQRDLNAERRELLAFLREIHTALNWAQTQDQQQIRALAIPPHDQADWKTKVQFYIWDSLQYEHLTRVVGRHLQAILQDHDINYLAWLFPPEELMPNPDTATCRSPITTVREVVRSHLAAPVAHYYSLIEIARVYHSQRMAQYISQQSATNPAYVPFNIHPLFGTPLSDQIPSERAHEIWSRVTQPHWQGQLNTYQRTVGIRLDALETVTERLEDDLGPVLAQEAPPIRIGPPATQARVCVDGQLWHAFSLLNKAIEETEVHQIRAMPPHERTARFKSARLIRRLTGAAEQAALGQMSLSPRMGRRVYELAPDSMDVKAKVGDFFFALAPERVGGFLDRKLSGLVWNTLLTNQYQARFGQRYFRVLMEDVTSVTVAGLDRNQRIVALDPSEPTILDDLQAAGLADFDRDLILDPVHNDFFMRKLLAALQEIGNPPLARNSPFAARSQAATSTPPAPGSRRRGANRTAHSPAADFLWNAGPMAASPVARNLAPARAALEAHGLVLNPTQWQAWEDALTHRARLVWGPPGTGKSRTVRAIVVGAVLEAHAAGRPLRVLVSATTYTAIDNVLQGISGDLDSLLPGVCPTYRLRSKYQPSPTAETLGRSIDVELNKSSPSPQVRSLRAALRVGSGLVVVGTPPEQAHNLLTCEGDPARAEWFDLIVIDEASQMDVAHAILPLCAIADGGSVVLAGDPLQLPPIHQAEAPAGLEDLVGSIYAFYRRLHGVPQSALGVNYRSNETIIEFARMSGYEQSLASHSPDLRVDLLAPLTTSQPPNWPPELYWTPEWATLLNPAQPAVCFVYDEGRSSQRNHFEADAVASLLFLLQGRMANQLANERHPVTGAPIPRSTTAYSPEAFWNQAVGVVTPHRAQQGLIVARLQHAFGATGALANAVRDAVDTVERFQGQQRDIIIASFSLGDPDQIAEEDEFLMSLNRFNVMASRARAKLIVLVSREVVDHLAGEIEVLRESRLLKIFAESFCDQSRAADFGYLQGGVVRPVPGLIRWRA